MADLFLEHFAGAVNTEVVNSAKLLGGVNRALCDGAGCAFREGSTGTVLYKYLSYPGRADYGAQLKVKFSNPSGAAPTIDLVLDVRDSENFTWLRVTPGSNASPWSGLNQPEIALGVRVGGTDSFLHGPVSINGGTGLAANTLYTIEVVRTLDVETGMVKYAVRFENSWLDDPRPAPLFDYSTPDLTHANLPLGFHFSSANATGKIDDLRCFELVTAEVESLDTRLVVGPDSMSLDDLLTRRISVQQLSNSYLAGQAFVFQQELPWHKRSYRPEQYVEWIDGGTTLFRGFIQKVSYTGQPGAKVITYTCRGRKARLHYVQPQDARTLSERIVWGGDTDVTGVGGDYVDADHALVLAPTNLNVADIVRWYFDHFADDLRKAGATRPDTGAAYNDGDLAPLEDVHLVRIELAGDLMAVLTQLFGQLQSWVFHHDSASDQWRFFKINGLDVVTMDTDDDRLAASTLTEDSTGIFTKVCIHSYNRERKKATAKTSDDSLLPDWDSAHEDVWSPDKARRASVTAVITGVHLGAGPLGEDEFDVSYAAAADVSERTYTNEWINGQVEFTSGAASGEVFGLLVQTAGSTPPNYAGTIRIAGNCVGTPVVTDSLKFSARREMGQSNRFQDVFKRFKIADAAKSKLVSGTEGGCPKLRAFFDNPSGSAGFGQVEVHKVKPFDFSGIKWGVDVTGPVIFPHDDPADADHPMNIPGGYKLPLEVELDYEYWEETVMQACTPDAGWHGTGYSDDNAKWDGGGVASGNDLAIERPLLIEEPEWKYVEETSKINERAAEILDAVSMRQFVGKPTFMGLRYDFAQLGKAIELTSPAGAMPTAGVYILLIEVVYDYSKSSEGIPTAAARPAGRTSFDLGGTALFAQMGRRFAEGIKAAQVQKMLEEVAKKQRDFERCWEQQVEQYVQNYVDAKRVCDDVITTSWQRIVPPTPIIPGGRRPRGLKSALGSIGFGLGAGLGDLMLTIDKTEDDFLAPGDSVLASGAFRFRRGGAYDELVEDDVAPAGSLDLLLALAYAHGLDIESADDLGGPVFIDTDGGLWRVTPGTFRLQSVQDASGGAGTGDNGGDYEPTAGVVDFSPSVSRIGGNLAISVKTPTAIGSSENNYSPTDFDKAVVWRVSASSASLEIRGLDVAGLPTPLMGTLRWLRCVGSNDILLKHQNGSATPANRFAFSGAADITLAVGKTVQLMYDQTSLRWVDV